MGQPPSSTHPQHPQHHGHRDAPGAPVPVLEPRCMLAPAVACRLWQRLSPSPFMVSMSSTEEARRTLWQLSRERLRARLQLEKAAWR